MNNETKTLSQIEKSALAAVRFFWMMTANELAACHNVLIPGGYIDAEGSWRLTAKGDQALGTVTRVHPGVP